VTLRRSMTYVRIAPGLVGACVLALSVGCGDELDTLGDGTGGGGTSGGDSGFAPIYEALEPECSSCHAPGAPARTQDIEATQDWSTRASAYASLQRTASGLIGNFQACNGVPFLGSTAEQSLLVAALDEDVRNAYDNPSNPDCNNATIADQTLKIGGPLPAQVIQDLKDWVDDGAPQ
jgi:hypothetical protein